MVWFTVDDLQEMTDYYALTVYAAESAWLGWAD
jgi:hypothetical protein